MPRRSQPEIHFVEARPTVQIDLPDGRVLEGGRGTHLAAFLKPVDKPEEPIVGAIVNGELRELTFPIEMDSRVQPVTMGTADGMRIYRRSLTFLVAAAFEELFPGLRLTVDHSVSSGGYFCQVSGGQALGADELKRLEERMHQLVEADLPFAKTQVPVEEAIEYFRAKGYTDKTRLLAHRRKPYLSTSWGICAITIMATCFPAPVTCGGSAWS